MPSIQHTLLKLSLKGTSIAASARPDIKIESLRNALDIGTVWMMLPWGVHFKHLKIKYMKAEWIKPYRLEKHKAILYLHGGGYALGSSQTHRAMVGYMAKELNAAALLIAYRKIPEHQYPAAVEDAVLGYRYLLKEGYAPEDILLAGDSAGGGLVITTLLELRKLKMQMPMGAVCLSPWLDLTVTGDSVEKNILKDPLVRVKEMREWGKIYAGKHSFDHPMLSPLKADLSGLPPLLIQASDTEILYSDALALAEVAKAAGVPVTLQIWKGLIHWWHIFWHFLPEAQEAIQKIKEFEALHWHTTTQRDAQSHA